MKVAVYNISLNEQDNVVQWALSANDADYIVLLDTGSTDETVKRARDAGVEVVSMSISPWRFDVARNKSLDLVPRDADLCIALDLDERLQPGWREELEKAWEQGITRPRYKYVWSWNEDGTEGLTYGGDKIHARRGFFWKHPVHEVITPEYGEVQGWTSLEIHHHPDNTKSRGQYFPLLELAVEEDPDDVRNLYYLGREYVYHNMPDKAAPMFHRMLALPGWAPERARAMIYLSDIENRESWLLKAAGEAANRREPWVALARYYYDTEQWWLCYGAASRALTIREKPLEYLNEEWAWGPNPWDYAAISAHHMGLHKAAYALGSGALAFDPDNARLKANQKFYADGFEFSA